MSFEKLTGKAETDRKIAKNPPVVRKLVNYTKMKRLIKEGVCIRRFFTLLYLT